MQWITTPGTVVASVFAVVTSILFRRARKRYLAIPLLPAVPQAHPPPDCMVVIPARNEESTVGGAIRSFPPDTVIVVDDHSSDKTVEEARAAGAGVLEAPPLIRGALGKSNACMAGARVLKSRWILFADADTRYQKGFLDSVVKLANDSGLSFLSVYLEHRPNRLAGHLIEPYATAVLFSGVRSADPTSMFTGQCVLVLREAYEFIGGHAAVWKHLAEGLNLALLAQKHRMAFAVARAGRLDYVRSTTVRKGASRGLQRRAFRLIQMSPWSGLSVLLTTLCAALWLPLAVWMAFTGHRVAPFLLVLLVVVQLRPWYGNGPRVLLAPLAIYATLPLLIRGVMGALFLRKMRWKGRMVKAA